MRRLVRNVQAKGEQFKEDYVFLQDRLNDIDHPEAEKPAKPAEKPPQKQAGRLLAESKKAIDAQQSNKTRSNLACLLSAFPVAAW